MVSFFFFSCGLLAGELVHYISQRAVRSASDGLTQRVCETTDELVEDDHYFRLCFCEGVVLSPTPRCYDLGEFIIVACLHVMSN